MSVVLNDVLNVWVKSSADSASAVLIYVALE